MMKMFKDVRPVVVLVVLVVGLGLFLGGQYAVKTYRLEEPFKAEVLSMKGIETIEMIENSKNMKVRLTLNSEVQLQEVYQQVKGLATEMLDQEIAIEIDQKASPELKEIYQEMHFAIYEGIASGKFTAMSIHLEEIAATKDVDAYQVQVDNDHVYLTLVEGDEVFGQVVPRGSDRLVYVNTTEGGGSQW